MTEINRALATIQRVTIIPHPNADKLEIAQIKGWQVVVQKGLHEDQSLVVYCEIDSFLPVEERYEWLRKSSFKSTKNLGDGFRIKTIKLRGEISQGIVIPLHEVSDKFPTDVLAILQEGDDVSDVLDIQKYEKPIPSNLMGRVRGNFPSFIPKTDQERVQNLNYKDYEKHGNDTFEVTTKLDGSSMTVYFNEGKFGVCSRNFDLEETEDNLFWQVFRKLKMEVGLEISGNYALQGELVGPGVNGNNARLSDHDFYLFDIYDIDGKRYLSPKERYVIFGNLIDFGINIKHVPIIYREYGFPTRSEALQMAEHVFHGVEAEGVVFKSNENSFSFKAISNKYLIKNDE